VKTASLTTLKVVTTQNVQTVRLDVARLIYPNHALLKVGNSTIQPNPYSEKLVLSAH
jgi:hypothetical protein